jgi:type II secretion system protein H
MQNVPVSRQAGYTLTELIIVVTILAVVAAIAVPATASNESERLELAAQEIAAAMRFARSEALRTGEPHGFRQQSGAKRIRVFRLDQGTSPATLIYDVYHPVDKQLYDFDLNLQSLAAADSLSRTAVFRGTCNQQGNVFFDADGTPWCADPDTVLLDTFEVDLILGYSRRTVILDDITGRVAVQ